MEVTVLGGLHGGGCIGGGGGGVHGGGCIGGATWRWLYLGGYMEVAVLGGCMEVAVWGGGGGGTWRWLY